MAKFFLNFASKMKKIVVFITLLCLFASCGQSYEERQRISRQERFRLLREDSLALKIALVPALDCLPLFVAADRGMFDSLKVDVRLKVKHSPLDCVEAFRHGKVEGMVSDLFHTERLVKRGMQLRYAGATDGYCQIIANRLSRVKGLSQLDGKLIAMSRYGVTDWLTKHALDSVKLGDLKAFRVQIHDPIISTDMLKNNELDAVTVGEPYATELRQLKNTVLLDSRNLGVNPGVIAFRTKALIDSRINGQYQKFRTVYNAACDSINRFGINYYAPILMKYCKVNEKTVAALPKMKFQHLADPRESDIKRANK